MYTQEIRTQKVMQKKSLESFFGTEIEKLRDSYWANMHSYEKRLFITKSFHQMLFCPEIVN